MAASELKLAPTRSAGMDRTVHHSRWSPARWPSGAKVAAAGAAIVMAIVLAGKFVAGTAARTLRVSSDVGIGRASSRILNASPREPGVVSDRSS